MICRLKDYVKKARAADEDSPDKENDPTANTDIDRILRTAKKQCVCEAVIFPPVIYWMHCRRCHHAARDCDGPR